jgi:hypothetical protein
MADQTIAKPLGLMDENTLKVSHFSPKKVMYNEY